MVPGEVRGGSPWCLVCVWRDICWAGACFARVHACVCMCPASAPACPYCPQLPTGPAPPQVLHVGEHRLRNSLPQLNLYHALNRTLEGRLAHLEPTHGICQMEPVSHATTH